MLIRQLVDPNPNARRYAAKRLGELKDTRAVPALIGVLKYEKWSLREEAAGALGQIGDTRAVPALIEALNYENVRGGPVWVLSEILNKCNTIEAVNEFETHLQEGVNSARKQWRKGVTTEFGLQISNLQIAAARKKDKLAPKHDILLDDIPKPPKRGKMYRTMERVRNG